ncbi:hypothetical protein AJ80_07782 [Polytolypa hystricis UAMH7299]|uniref:Nascent polypeptide-associated complex subunit alpha-like UBA domain-containing protein n=1 Tax=Polytolypa hystricis (strain UAMH7299) TaxID=1447883 RepID=A0A2B7XAS3_POLH7|nr:hypothetical protein AJ80_07782 [Polytolypa hystricis UAMH7299]
MAEPLPKASGDKDAEDTLPANAEDRAAAAALSSLNATTGVAENGDAGAPSGAKLPSAADQEALGKAMSRLEAAVGKKDGTAKKGKENDVGKSSAGTTATAGAEEVVKKKLVVKVAVDDVNMLVDQLDLSKPKATELLRAHEGDRVKAIRAFISPTTTTA